LAARLRALVAAASGEDESGDAGFASAAEHFGAVGMRFEVARVQTEHAEWLVSRGRREDAEPLMEEAREVFEELRAAPWLERLDRLGGTAEVAAGTRAAEL
jgi:hypothetical protein